MRHLLLLTALSVSGFAATALGGAFDAEHTSGTVQYPHVIEQDGHLVITYARHKTAIEVIRVALVDVEKLHQGAR